MHATVLYLQIIISKLLIGVCINVYTNITDSLFPLNNDGRIIAYGDLNSDKNVDLFILGNNGKQLKVYMNENKRFSVFPKNYLIALNDSQIINNAIPADFDGDSILDVLLVVSENYKQNLIIYWNSKLGFDNTNRTIITSQFFGSPLIFDYNGDMIPDLCVESSNGQRQYWIASTKRTFHQIDVTTEELSGFANPDSHSFADINSDLIPDIFITSNANKPGIQQFENWINKNGRYSRDSVYTSQVFWDTYGYIMKQYDIHVMSHSVLTDFTASGQLKHLILICSTNLTNFPDLMFSSPSNLPKNSNQMPDKDKFYDSQKDHLCPEWAILIWTPVNNKNDKDYWEALYRSTWISANKTVPKNRNAIQRPNFMIDFNYTITTQQGSKIKNYTDNTYVQFIPPRMSVGDFNFDGYPDILIVATLIVDEENVFDNDVVQANYNGPKPHKKKIIRTPIILQNIPCGNSVLNDMDWVLTDPLRCTSYDRKLILLDPFDKPIFVNQKANVAPNTSPITPATISPLNLPIIQNAVLASFFDIYNDGLLDIFVVTDENMHHEYGREPQHRIQAFRNDMELDASFVKVLALNGRCWMDCKLHSKPYGIIPPGAVFKYKTTYSKDAPTQAISCQMMQTSHFSLNLPYVIFGLGRRPNFIDKLEVGFAHPITKKPRYHNWASIIPNSQMIIIPYPLDEPTKWQHILLLTPSYFLLKIGVTLIATCLFLAAVIFILHWKEKREDFTEKLHNIHQFHFDAL